MTEPTEEFEYAEVGEIPADLHEEGVLTRIRDTSLEAVVYFEEDVDDLEGEE